MTERNRFGMLLMVIGTGVLACGHGWVTFGFALLVGACGTWYLFSK
jgi:hypothetical protein